MAGKSRIQVDKEHTILGNYLFLAEIDEVKIGFRRISNIQHSVEYDTFVEGGINGYVHAFLKPASQAQTLTLEKGISFEGSKALDQLKILPGARFMTIDIKVCAKSVNEGRFAGENLLKTYRAANCMVTKWEIGNLDAMSNEILIEHFEFVHCGIRPV